MKQHQQTKKEISNNNGSNAKIGGLSMPAVPVLKPTATVQRVEETKEDAVQLKSSPIALNVVQLQKDTDHVNNGGLISFYRFNSTMTENSFESTRDAAKTAAVAKLGSTGKKKVETTLAGVDNARDGEYIVYQNDEATDKVLVEHTADDNARLRRYHTWRDSTQIGHRDQYDTVKHFHAATIPKIAGENKADWRRNLGANQFPGYTQIGANHHFYYAAAPTTASGAINILRGEINEP